MSPFNNPGPCAPGFDLAGCDCQHCRATRAARVRGVPSYPRSAGIGAKDIWWTQLAVRLRNGDLGRISLCSIAQEIDRNGCHLDSMAEAQRMDPHTVESVMQFLRDSCAEALGAADWAGVLRCDLDAMASGRLM
jgi:hypothetical protein